MGDWTLILIVFVKSLIYVMNRHTSRRIPIFQSAERALGSGDLENGTDYCKVCGKYNLGKENLGWHKDSIKLKELEGNIASCNICQLVVVCLREYQRRQCPKLDLPSILGLRCHPGMFLEIKECEQESVGKGSKRDVLSEAALEIFVEPGTPTPIKDIGVGFPIQHDISSPACMALARSWLRKCEAEHTDCRPPPNAPLPSRVLDIGFSSTDPVKLVEACALSVKTGRWATLSHCWGKVQPLTTTTGTLAERKKGIVFDALPKTFQDAVMVSRELKLRYLWIDSLCILQDSKEDWEREASRMAEVYANSVVTIAATAAEDSRGGCFVPKFRARPSIVVQLRSLAGEEYAVIVREVANRSHNIGSVGIGKFPNLPLSRRAWVLQERLLSNRLLMYTDCELVFECRMDLWCECGLYPLRCQTESGYKFQALHQQSVYQYSRELFGVYVNWALVALGRKAPVFLEPFTALLQRTLVDGYLLDREGLYQFWESIVDDYTSRCLTFDRDVLPALSGIASLVRGKLGDEYLAGIWRGNILSWLLWSRSAALFKLTNEEYQWLDADLDKTVSDELKVYLPTRTIANPPPTWSWSSVRAAVDWRNKWLQNERGFRMLREPAIVTDAKCILASDSPTGIVLGGSLSLNGPMKEVRLVGYERDRNTLLHRARVADITCVSNAHDHEASCLTVNEDDWAILDVPFREPTTIEGFRMWCFRIGVLPPPHMAQFHNFAHQFLTNSEEISNSHTLHYCLILMAHGEVGAKPAFFQRCGLYIKHMKPGDVDQPGIWTQVIIR